MRVCVEITSNIPPDVNWNKVVGRGREQALLQGAPPKMNQMKMIRAGPDNASILMLKSAQHVITPGRTAKPISVQVPVNPAC